MIISTKRFLSLALPAIILIAAVGCKHKPYKPEVGPDIDPASTQYPLDIAEIMIKKCATSGCHNEASYAGAGSLRLDDWSYLFDGSANGAVIVPYDTVNSSMLYFLNPGAGVYDALSVAPTMPYEREVLSEDEYRLIKNWIAKGAPDKNGNVPFADKAATRQKVYMTQQRCDILGVVDVEKNVVMRNIQIGSNGTTESPHFVKVDKNGDYAYVCFVTGNVIQKIDVRTDKIVGAIDLSPFNNGGSDFNIVQVSPDGKELVASQLLNTGIILLINAETMQPKDALAYLKNPHGIAYNQSFDTFYITGQYGNTVYVLPKTGIGLRMISIDDKAPIQLSTTDTAQYTPNPHEIMMSPDYSKYFLTCQKTNDVRVMDRLGDTLLKVIPVGTKPQEMAISTTMPYLFVSCLEDKSPLPKARGSIYVIDYNKLEIVKRIDGGFFQPHGMALDDKSGRLYIGSRNLDVAGPAPHHVSGCAGRNGYYQVYNINTLQPENNRRYEVTPDPYSLDMRFK